ncbi:hypothetical protein GYA93_12565 [Gordonia desulfuricans]|uniref:Uncharacterized protein n=1 Tax=Gordonia desulfuricans TaxID=89051 RepID=A0A7K3LQ59_9ACTN|nr:hypothetical protein [Gordonia desulfuricans]NDK90404.1 hypothetical protein [Gordonia desulfuricans]
MTRAEARRGALLGLAIAIAVLAGIALIVLGVVYGGSWRWAGGAATLALLVAIVVPGFVKDKQNNSFEGEKR